MSGRETEVLRVHVPSENADWVSDWLLEQGAQGVELGSRQAERVWLTVYADAEQLEALARALPELLGAEQVECRREQLGVDWVQRYEESLPEVQLTPRTRLVPSYQRNVDRGRLHLEPGMYFGFGDHPTTALIARWVERRAGGRRALDVGTGTGVLALLAARAGARQVVGCDLDVASVEAARRNAERNAIENCRFTVAPVAELEQRFDLVVANIVAPTLIALAPALHERLRPGGELALSGLLGEQLESVLQAYRRLGVLLRVAEVREPWVLLCGSSDPDTSAESG